VFYARSTVEQLEARALLSAGDIDVGYRPAFNNIDSRFAFQSVVHMQVDGKSIHYSDIDNTQTLWRQYPNGALDRSFGSGGKVILDQQDHVVDMVVAPDLKIVVYYFNIDHMQTIHVARYTANGAADRSFGGDGDISISIPKSFNANSVVALSDGRILLGGESNLVTPSPALYRLNANGTLDNSFGSGGLVKLAGSGQILDLDPRRKDNRIAAAGIGNVQWKVWVLAPDGNEEWTSGLNVPIDRISSSEAQEIAVDGDGSIVVSGDVSYVVDDSGSPRVDTTWFVGRYPGPKSSGSFKYINTGSDVLALQSDGKVLTQGSDDVLRLNYDMTLDRSFGYSGRAGLTFAAASITVDGDGGILIDGSKDMKLFQQRLRGDNPTVFAYGRTNLKIFGTPARDTLIITKSAGLIGVSRNGVTPFYFTASKVKRLIIDAGAGNDTIRLPRSAPISIIKGGDGKDTLFGRRKKDRLSSIERRR